MPPPRPPIPPEAVGDDVDRLTGELVGTAALELDVNQLRRLLSFFTIGTGWDELVVDRAGESVTEPPPPPPPGLVAALGLMDVFTSRLLLVADADAREPPDKLTKSSSINSAARTHELREERKIKNQTQKKNKTKHIVTKRKTILLFFMRLLRFADKTSSKIIKQKLTN